MSLPDDLRFGLESAQRHAKERRKGTEELIQLLRERASHESFYAQGLERLGNHPYVVTTSGSLSQAVQALKANCVFKAAKAREFSDTILSEFADPLKDLLKAQVIANKTQESLLHRSVTDLRYCKEQVGIVKNDYEQQFRAIEKFVVHIESVGSPLEKKKMLSMQTEDVNKSMEKATKAYREAVKKYNCCLSGYQDELSTMLNSFKLQEEERLTRSFSALSLLLTLDKDLTLAYHSDLMGRLEVRSK